MSHKVKVSVLVPVYNVEKYLLEFLNTLVNQTLKEIEIIIVNDFSPDNCGIIINKFLNDKRIRYINKTLNEGLWKARQSAYEIANGEYVINLDPDDLIDLNYLEKLYGFGKSENLDFVLSNVKIIDEHSAVLKHRQLKQDFDEYVLSSDNDYRLLLGTAYATWFRLVKKELLFSKNYNYLMGELNLFSYQFCDGVRVGIDSSVSYHYRKHSTSLSNYDKSSKRLSSSNEFNIKGLARKIKKLEQLQISKNSKKLMLFIYTYRVFYSLTIISWLHSLPTKKERKEISRFLRVKLKFSIKSFLKNFKFFRKSDGIFLTLCILHLEKLVYFKLKRDMKNKQN